MTALLCLAPAHLTNKHKQVESKFYSYDQPNKMSKDISRHSGHKVTIYLTKVMCLHFLFCGVSACVLNFI
jgi:hypothetical protein